MIPTLEIEKIIQQSNYGEYDQYHDWTPSYTLPQKAEFLKQMLSNWNITETDAQKLVIQFTRTLVKESGSSCLDITNILVSYFHLPEITGMINEFLFSGIFCRDLLISFKNTHLRQDEVLLKIDKYYKERKFIEKKREVNLKELYHDINNLLSELENNN
jgi:hypothetical protein